MELIQQNEIILLIWDSSFDLEKSGFDAESLKVNFGATAKFENIHRLNLGILVICFLLIFKISNTFNLEFNQRPTEIQHLHWYC